MESVGQIWPQLQRNCKGGFFLLQFRTFYSSTLPETSLKYHIRGLKVVHLEEIYNR